LTHANGWVGPRRRQGLDCRSPLLFAAALVAAAGLRLYRRLGDQAGLAPIEAPRIFKNGAIAQLGERFNGIEEVVGSIPSGSTTQLADITGFPVSLDTFETSVTYALGAQRKSWRDRDFWRPAVAPAGSLQAQNSFSAASCVAS
jgi:hypothetical protein